MQVHKFIQGYSSQITIYMRSKFTVTIFMQSLNGKQFTIYTESKFTDSYHVVFKQFTVNNINRFMVTIFTQSSNRGVNTSEAYHQGRCTQVSLPNRPPKGRKYVHGPKI